MSNIQVQLRRGTTAQHGSFTGAQGELTVDTDKNALVLHDGATQGGIQVARDEVTATGSTTARSLEDRFADVVNVADFSGWGGTASQNRGALSAALNYVETGVGQNKTVYIPEGEYEIDQAVSIVSSSIIKGAGSGSTILKLIDNYGAGNKLFNIFGRSDIRIQDIQFDGNRAGQTDFEADSGQPNYDNGNICLYVVGASNVTIDNCYFKNWSKDAVYLDATPSYPTGPSKININTCKFDTIYRNGISVIEGESLSFTNNYFFGGASLDKVTEVVLNNGIRIEPDSNGENIIDCVVSNNQFKDLHGGFNVYGNAVTSGTTFRNIVVSDNLFNNIVSEAAVVLYKTDLNTAESTDEDGFILSGNKFYNCGPTSGNNSVAYGGGVSVNRCNNVIISNNFFNQCGGNEATVGLNQAGLNTNINNNTFQLDQKRAIIINSPVDTTRTSLNITNNICSRGSQSSLGTYPAIRASGNASASGAYFISNNTIQTNTSNSYGIGIQTGYDDGTSIIAKNQIQGNGVSYEHSGGTRFENLFEIYEETVTTSGALSDSLTYDITRTDNVVTLELGSLIGTTTATSSIGITTTLPERFRPSTVLFGFCNVIINNVADSQPGIIEVRNNGLVQVSRGGLANFTTDSNSGFSGVTFTYSI